MSKADNQKNASLLKKAISSNLKALLGETPSYDLIKSICPTEWDKIQKSGDRYELKTFAELIANKILRFAIDEAKPNVWAVEIALDRSEGKLGTNTNVGNESLDDLTYEKLDKATQAQINRSAQQYLTKFRKVTEQSDRSSLAGQYDVSDNRDGDSEKSVG